MNTSRFHSMLRLQLQRVTAISIAAGLALVSSSSFGTDPLADFIWTFNGSKDGKSFSITGEGSTMSMAGTSVAQTFIDPSDANFIFPNVPVDSGFISGTGGISLGGATATAVELGSDPMFVLFDFLTFNAGIILINGTGTLSGTLSNLRVADFGIPGVNTFEQLFDLDNSPFLFTKSGGYYHELVFISNFMPTVAASGSVTQSEPTFLVTDFGAIQSAFGGLQMANMNRQITHHASRGATRDLNQRIFRARAGFTTGDSSASDTTSSVSSDLQYLQFASSQMIDHRVALGLADGSEVELVSDTLSNVSGHPFGMMGGAVAMPVTMKAVVAVPDGSGKETVADKVVIEDAPDSRFQVYSAFDYGYYDQDNLSERIRGFDVDNYSGSLGAEVRATDWLMLGAAFTQTWSDSESTAGLGSIDLEGQLLSGYATAVFGDSYLDVLYSYGNFDNEINRNTLLGRTAYGDTESSSHNISLNSGHNFRLANGFTLTPFTGLDYSNGEIDGYTERGGANANLVFPDDDFESMTGRLGAAISHTSPTGLGLLTTQVRAGWSHEFMPDGDPVSASLQTSPFALVTGGRSRRIGDFTATSDGAHAGTDWLELGAGVRLDLGNTGLNLQLDYEGQFARNNASAHFGAAKIGFEW